jgi:hypothetical protein
MIRSYGLRQRETFRKTINEEGRGMVMRMPYTDESNGCVRRHIDGETKIIESR